MSRKLVIDTDPGVDDAMAILMTLGCSEFEALGLTTIFGNAATNVTTPNALRLLEAAGRSDIPVARGAEVTNGIDGIFVHDPSTVAFLLESDAFTVESWAIRVETESFSRGKTWPNLGNTDDATPPAWQGRPLVDVCTAVDADRVVALVEDRLT